MRKPRPRAHDVSPGLRALVLALSGAALLAACSVAGIAPEAEAAAAAEELPSAVLSNYVHTVVERGNVNFVLKAATAEVYDTSKRTLLQGVSFMEYDPDTGALLSLGSADQAVYYSDSKDAEFSGSVRLESRKQDAILTGEYLKWSDKEKRLEGRLDRTVTISRSDGSFVSGAGFEVDARRKAFSFRGSGEGMIAAKSEEIK